MAPIDRFIVAPGFKAIYWVVSHDASASGYGATLHVVSERLERNKVDTENFRSMIALSKSVVSESTVFKNEAKSFGIAFELVETLARAWRGILPEGKLKIFCIGDNKPACSVMSNNEFKEATLIGTRAMVTDVATKVIKWIPGTEIVFSWLDSKFHPADLVSKLHENISKPS